MVAKAKYYADVIFPVLEKELQRDPSVLGSTKGYFIVRVKHKKSIVRTWYIILRGSSTSDSPAASVSINEPQKDKVKGLEQVSAEIEDRDLLKLVTGGLTGLAAINTKKLLIEGDLVLAKTVEDIFVKKAGGVQRAREFISSKYPSIKAKL